MSGNAPPVNGPGDDPDVDKMLQDDNESPPYSPVEDNPDPDIVWRGTVSMDAVAKFPAYAKQVAGPDLSQNRMQTPWSELLHKDLKGPGNVRDTYLVPVPPGPGNIPDFVVNLLEHNLPEDRPEPSILVTLVVRNGWEQPSRIQSFDGASDPHSPAYCWWCRSTSDVDKSSGSSYVSQSSCSFRWFPLAVPAVPKPDERYQHQNFEEQRRIAQAEGEAVALRILGEYSRAPTVSFLMRKHIR
ncbi:hypothetical protein DID88_004537 [Monilinia fructigena]|uniref:Spen paralogue and orthologue SPOC C-terminal domain-containing protein n=1 Tax=Monilinia fructigena TaxID=38457 RepID=A0A395IS60_9HELO|nr:hypothetical protein DID88_004537 [Monilinia fructigena]